MDMVWAARAASMSVSESPTNVAAAEGPGADEVVCSGGGVGCGDRFDFVGREGPAYRRPSLSGLPPGNCVVALGRVGGMPHPGHSTEPGVALVSAIPETRPPGERAFWVVLDVALRLLM
jgi:hypothetical protein